MLTHTAHCNGSAVHAPLQAAQAQAFQQCRSWLLLGPELAPGSILMPRQHNFRGAPVTSPSPDSTLSWHAPRFCSMIFAGSMFTAILGFRQL